MNPRWNVATARGSGFLHENFSPFHQHLPPEKGFFLVLFGMAPSLCDFLLSILASKWAALTLILCTQHCVQVSHLHVPHQNFASTRFSRAYEVLLYSTQLLTARTVHMDTHNLTTQHYSASTQHWASLLRGILVFLCHCLCNRPQRLQCLPQCLTNLSDVCCDCVYANAGRGN